MTKIRKSNTILNALVDKFHVNKNWLDTQKSNSVFHIYKSNSGGGADYYFTIDAPLSRKKSVLFNGKEYNDVETLLKAVDEFNDSRPFPAHTYDPVSTRCYNEQLKIHWYLVNKLGLSWNFSTGDTYSMLNAMGEKMFSLNFEMDYNKRGGRADKNSMSGTIIRHMRDNKMSFITIPFDNAEQAVRKINSLIASELVINVNINLNVLENLSGMFDKLEDARMGDIDTMFNGKTKMYRDKIIPVLEELLVALKS